MRRYLFILCSILSLGAVSALCSAQDSPSEQELRLIVDGATFVDGQTISVPKGEVIAFHIEIKDPEDGWVDVTNDLFTVVQNLTPWQLVREEDRIELDTSNKDSSIRMNYGAIEIWYGIHPETEETREIWGALQVFIEPEE